MKKLICAVSAVVLSSAALAQEALAPEQHWITPLEVGIASPIQFPSPSWRVDGIRFDLFFGDSYEVNGIDFGLVGRTRNDLCGIALNAFNWNDDSVYGVQLGALANVVLDSAYGVQFGGLVNYNYNEMNGLQFGLVNHNGSFYGVQFGLLNANKGVSYGGQLGLVNIDVNEFNGAAFGLVNWSARTTGAQFGFVNVCNIGSGFQLGAFNAAETFDGVQIGLVNIIQKGALPIMCIANANF